MVVLPSIQLLILQPTPFCNLNCAYCYLPNRTSRRTMRDDTLAAIGKAVVASPAFNGETTLVWHAGEPCVLPPHWYRAATTQIAAAARRSPSMQSFQTNATLIDDAWVEFFQEPGVRVGVSLDGPEDIHDSRRRTRSGGGTHASTMRGINRLRKGGVPFHVIAVVTAASLANPERVAKALIDSGAASIGLNVEEIDGVNGASSLFEEPNSNSYRIFLQRFLDTIERAERAPRVREIDRFHKILAHGADERRAHHQENIPGAIISVGVGGEVSTFSPELLGLETHDYGGFRFGDIHNMRDISETFLSAAFLRAYRDVRAGVRVCRANCAYFGICGGGSPANKLGEHGRFNVGETMQCRLTVMATFETMLDRAKTRRSCAS